ncbi:MAG: EamA family transporter [Anaerolineae bacterium]
MTIDQAILPTLFWGLLSSLIFGSGDFCGGLASKKNNVFTVVVGAHLIGGITMALLAVIFGESFPTLIDMGWGAAAGIVGAAALMLLYRALSAGRMGIVAPIAAVVSAAIPIVWGAIFDGFPTWVRMFGFAIALIAVLFISLDENSGRPKLAEVWMPFLAGAGFSFFFILVDQISTGSVFWPLVSARITSVSLFGLYGWITGKLSWPEKGTMLTIGLAGIFDTLGNAFFILSTQAGRFDVASVMGSLYPASTIFLARFVLDERLIFVQWIGVVLAAVAVVLIALA